LHASVLISLGLRDGALTLQARTFQLASHRGLGKPVPDGARVIGYVFSDFDRERFMPLVAQTIERTAAWADHARMPAIYFEFGRGHAIVVRRRAAAGD
jgi:hypothetical protein